jgi:uncharacterized protein YbaA (DUF1428 family)
MVLADITIVPVSTERKAEYLEFSKRMVVVYRDHGAMSVVDYWQASSSANQADFHADGTSYEPGELRSIADSVGVSTSESVVVTVMTWPSREARDRGTATAAEDPRVLETLDKDPVFDGRRVIGETFEMTMSLQDDE